MIRTNEKNQIKVSRRRKIGEFIDAEMLFERKEKGLTYHWINIDIINDVVSAKFPIG